MRIYLINLARRPDRLAAMIRQTVPLGLSLERIEAVDAESEEPGTVNRYEFKAKGNNCTNRIRQQISPSKPGA